MEETSSDLLPAFWMRSWLSSDFGPAQGNWDIGHFHWNRRTPHPRKGSFSLLINSSKSPIDKDARESRSGSC